MEYEIPDDAAGERRALTVSRTAGIQADLPASPEPHVHQPVPPHRHPSAVVPQMGE